MTAYSAQTGDIIHVLNDIAGFGEALDSGAFGDLDRDMVQAILEEAGKFAAEVLAPLNKPADEQGTVLENGVVKTPDGWKKAYDQWVSAGWNGLYADQSHGGQGLPFALNIAISELLNSASMSFGICPTLTQGAADAIAVHGSDDLKARFLPKMVSGAWTGTMNLTESQAGSDLALLRARAEPRPDGTYAIFGTKIFITYGDHDLTENIIHLVLARLKDAPRGVKGLSLFLVPKINVNEDGSLGQPNDVKCLKLEHKLGIHASATCVMAYGEDKGAVGYLVGEENRGLNCMFTMMNKARLHVGVQGVGVAERAYQQALAYARERKQGSRPGDPGQAVPIIEHPDVRRQLLSMRALTQASRAICLACATAIDLAEKGLDEQTRARNAGLVALLTPIAKAFSTDAGVDVASLGIQVHGGMGYIEETGAAQHLRDARIAPIYEGTNGLQAIDLVTRKITAEDGGIVRAYIEALREIAAQVVGVNDAGFGRTGDRLTQAVEALDEATGWLQRTLPDNVDLALAGAVPYLRLFGLAAGGAYLAVGALKSDDNGGTGAARIALARYFAENHLPETNALSSVVRGGGAVVSDVSADPLAL